MVYMVECGEHEAKEVEGLTMVGKQATEGLANIVPFNTPVEGFSAGNVESEATKGHVGGITEATEYLRVKFEKMRVNEGPSLRANMVDLNQPSPEMEKVERYLKMER